MNEKVQFRLIQAPCCGTLLCWVNPRLPNYCPECGTFIYPELKSAPQDWIKHEQVLWLREEPRRTYDKSKKKEVPA